jgi:hypothetical protein
MAIVEWNHDAADAFDQQHAFAPGGGAAREGDERIEIEHTAFPLLGNVVYLTPAFTVGEDGLRALTSAVVDTVRLRGR